MPMPVDLISSLFSLLCKSEFPQCWLLIIYDFIRFDPYPYILLNLILSCTAALQAPVIYDEPEPERIKRP